MKHVVDSVSSDLLRKKNVVAVATGQKWTKGKNTGKDAILIFVSKKEYSNKIKPNDLIPSNINGVVTDVVGKTGEFGIHTNIEKQRPIQGGISCGHLWVTAGTIGGFFIDRDNKVVGLSNNHVLAAENAGRKGNVTLQPGKYDNNNWLNNIVGTLKNYRSLTIGGKQSYDPVNKRHINYNLEDSATFQVNSPETMIDTDIKGIGAINDFRLTVPVGESVQKSGRTTEVTTGTVIGINATVVINYGSYNLQFRDQIITNGMSQGGDSGSLLLDMNKNIVGLLFAGSDSMTVHNRIIYPKETYNLSIYRNVKIAENLTYVLKVNDIITANSYKASDFEKAISDAKALARNGATVEITTAYTVAPE